MNDLQFLSFLLLWVVILAEMILLFLLYRHVGLIYAPKPAGLALGHKAPGIDLVDAKGTKSSLQNWLTTNNNLIIFGSFDCTSCRTLLRDKEVRNFLEGRSMPAYFIALSTETFNSDLAELREEPNGLEIMMAGEEAFRDYRVDVTPFAYFLDQEGRVLARGPVAGPQNLVSLWDQTNRNGGTIRSDIQALTVEKRYTGQNP